MTRQEKYDEGVKVLFEKYGKINKRGNLSISIWDEKDGTYKKNHNLRPFLNERRILIQTLDLEYGT